MTVRGSLEQRWITAAAFGAALLAALGLFAVFRNHGFDDSYITFRYAANLAGGQGFVYNPGQRVLSTTAPLYALLLAPAAALQLNLPLLANLLACLSYAAGGLAIAQLGRLWALPLAGAVGGMLYIGYPLWMSSLGGETALYQAFVLWGFVATAAARYRSAALLLALATLVRSDGALAGLCAGVYILIGCLRSLPPAERSLPALLRRLPWSAAIVYLLLITPWFLFAWSYFGAPFPVTLDVKRLQGQLLISRSYLGGLIDYLGQAWAQPIYRPLLLLALLGSFMALRRPRWLLPIGWGGLYLLAYGALGVPGYGWYYIPPISALLIAAGLGLASLAAWVARRSVRWAGVTALALSAAMLISELYGLSYLAARPDPRLGPYRLVGEWLAANSRVDQSVGALEVGIIGYYSQRPMVDFAGLISPEIADYYGPNAYRDSARYAVERYQPQFIVAQEPEFPLAAIVERPDRCRMVFATAAARPESRLQIHRCDW